MNLMWLVLVFICIQMIVTNFRLSKLERVKKDEDTRR